MAMLFGALAKNGEILDTINCGENNYMIAINIGNQRNKIPSYSHIRTEKSGISAINSNLGNLVEPSSKKSVIIRSNNSGEGYYVYDLETGKRVSGFYDYMKFINYDGTDAIYAKDTIRDNIGKVFIDLATLLNYSGEMICDVFNISTNEYYNDIKNGTDYELLKNSIREQINSNKPTEEQICKKLLQKRRKINESIYFVSFYGIM